MKKLILIALLAGLVATTVQAQYFVASYGYIHDWNMPYAVEETLEDEFWGYDIIHAQRVEANGRLFFDIMLQRGTRFTEVRLSRRGRIIEKARWDYFPLNDHVCGAFCGFHSSYYTTYYRPYHYGHQHYYGCGHYVAQPKIAHHYGYKNKHNHANKGSKYGNGHKNNQVKQKSTNRSYPSRRQSVVASTHRQSNSANAKNRNSESSAERQRHNDKSSSTAVKSRRSNSYQPSRRGTQERDRRD